jgi:hypothetical protein
MRQLSSQEIERIQVLTSRSIDLAFLEPTKTGLGKSIMDATAPVRLYLKENNLHDFDKQGQGQEHKRSLNAYLFDGVKFTESKCSLYRPNSKDGDPRIWFGGLPALADANDIIGFFHHEKTLYVINITKTDIQSLVASGSDNELKKIIGKIRRELQPAADELLAMIRLIAAKGPIAGDVNADTAVGRTLERELGLKTNSSKNPDYKGIEIKSFRGERENRKTLFAQVPDWKLSPLKSSAAILDTFGYDCEDFFALRCEIGALKPNSQGLYLELDEASGYLKECSTNPKYPVVAVWSMEKLHERLLSKHNETFWVTAISTMIDGRECFTYTKIQHTRKPILAQFDLLIKQGLITIDHLITRKKGKVKEQGPLIKVKTSALHLLLPIDKEYDLTVKNC